MHVFVCAYVSIMYAWVYIVIWIYAYWYNHFYLSDWQINILKIFSVREWIKEVSTLIHFVRNVGSLVPSWERKGRNNLAISISFLNMHILWPIISLPSDNLLFRNNATSAWNFLNKDALNVCIHKYTHIPTYIHNIYINVHIHTQ